MSDNEACTGEVPDAWGVFGSDSDDDDDDDDSSTGSSSPDLRLSTAAESATLYILKTWLAIGGSIQKNVTPAMPLTERFFLIQESPLFDGIWKILQEKIDQRGIKNSVMRMDDLSSGKPQLCADGAAIFCEDKITPDHEEKMNSLILPGGHLLVFSLSPRAPVLSPHLWYTDAKPLFLVANIISVYSVHKRSCTLNHPAACAWKFTSLDRSEKAEFLKHEYDILEQVTCPLSHSERQHPERERRLHHSTIFKAVHALNVYGFCILKDLFPLEDERVFRCGDAAIADLKHAVRLLREDGVDLLNPGSIDNPEKSYIHNYREMAMREDLRVDLRDGPQIQSVDFQNQTWLTEHKDILRILSLVMNPRNAVEEYHKGNYGRWNFESSGPDSPPDSPKPSKGGFVISLPGCVDQQLHADTPHLFEHMDCLPPHYINMFILASREGNDQVRLTGKSHMGGTAFVAGSHRLSVCKAHTCGDEVGKREMHKNIIRPSLTSSDVLLFDTRILHFGLANVSDKEQGEKGWRPMMYINWWQKWFSDPKNWENEKKLFPDLP